MLNTELLRELLLNTGECFTPKEAKEFFKQGKESSDKRLVYFRECALRIGLSIISDVIEPERVRPHV